MKPIPSQRPSQLGAIPSGSSSSASSSVSSRRSTREAGAEEEACQKKEGETVVFGL